jgi:hypothetical protein
MRTYISALLAVSLVVVLASCKKDSTNPAGAAPTINGTWTIVSATANGQPIDPAEIFNNPGTVSARFTFAANGVFTLEEKDAQGNTLYTESGTFTVTGQNITVSITQANGQPHPQPFSITGTWAVAGNQLTFTFTDQQNNTIILMFTRV